MKKEKWTCGVSSLFGWSKGWNLLGAVDEGCTGGIMMNLLVNSS